jgi:hypothetical protein
MEALRLFFEVVNGLWLLVLSVAVFQLWERSGMDQEKQEEEWQPVDLSDDRELELERQEQLRNQWRV